MATDSNVSTKSNLSTPSIVPPPVTSDDDMLTRMAATIELAEQALGQVDMVIDDVDVMTDAVDTIDAIPSATDAENKKTAVAVSVVIPVYNERDTIREIVARVRAIGIHHEIVIVDDFSIDGTRPILTELAEEADIRVLLHGYNRGKGAALRTAFEHVQGDVVLIQDADLEYDPADYPKLLAPIEQDKADVVYGSRFLEKSGQDTSRLHRLGNRILTLVSNLFTGQRLTDMETCYKVFRNVVLTGIDIEQNRFGFEPEITAKISHFGHRIHEVPIRYNSRSYDEGKKIGIKDAFNALWCIVKYR